MERKGKQKANAERVRLSLANVAVRINSGWLALLAKSPALGSSASIACWKLV